MENILNFGSKFRATTFQTINVMECPILVFKRHCSNLNISQAHSLNSQHRWNLNILYLLYSTHSRSKILQVASHKAITLHILLSRNPLSHLQAQHIQLSVPNYQRFQASWSSNRRSNLILLNLKCDQAYPRTANNSKEDLIARPNYTL